MPNLCLSQAHCSAFQRTPAHDASDPSLSTASSYAHLHEHGPRSENPGVGGSIPSQPTVLLSSLPEFVPRFVPDSGSSAFQRTKIAFGGNLVGRGSRAYAAPCTGRSPEAVPRA